MSRLPLILCVLLGLAVVPHIAGAENIDARAGVQNVAPRLLEVGLGDLDDDDDDEGDQVDPSPGEARKIEVWARAQDDNGWKDFASASFVVKAPSGATVASEVEKDGKDKSGRTLRFETEVELPEKPEAGLYNYDVEVVDVHGAKSKKSGSFLVTEIVAYAIDGKSVVFASGPLAPGSSTRGNPASLAIRNTGNVPLHLQISGTDLTAVGFDAKIASERIRYAPIASLSGERGLPKGPFVDTSFLIPVGGAAKPIYFAIDVPTGDEQYIPAADYTGSITLGVVVAR
ncbi:MAG TPA: hypothetical protein VM889_06090 [Candidatus Thermoplasmatota archaeon]|nr:hypothetical protein [Candidatus Thermoplasmatota archaeon]